MAISDAKERLENLARRVKKLEERIERQKIGPEVDAAIRLVSKLNTQYEQLQKDNGIFIPEATSAKMTDGVCEEELIQKLGSIYWIFGPSFEETFSFKTYRIEFLHIMPNDHIEDGCLMRVRVKIYENDKPFIMKDAKLEFWKSRPNSLEVDDVGLAWSDDETKYSNTHWFQKLAYTLAQTWNKYFREIPRLEARNAIYLESGITNQLED